MERQNVQNSGSEKEISFLPDIRPQSRSIEGPTQYPNYARFSYYCLRQGSITFLRSQISLIPVECMNIQRLKENLVIVLIAPPSYGDGDHIEVVTIRRKN